MIVHEVLFDGTREKPWGRMIFAIESVQVPNPPRQIVIYGDRTSSIKRAIRQQHDWFTSDQIASLANVSRDMVTNTLAGMVRKGEVIKARKLPMQRHRRYQYVG